MDKRRRLLTSGNFIIIGIFYHHPSTYRTSQREARLGSAAAVHGGIYLLVCTHAWPLFAFRSTTSLLARWTSRLQADGLQVHGPPWQLDGGMQRRIRWNTDDDRVDRHRCTDKRWIWLSYHVARQQNCDLRLHRTFRQTRPEQHACMLSNLA